MINVSQSKKKFDLNAHKCLNNHKLIMIKILTISSLNK
jgi:hypothetical protein